MMLRAALGLLFLAAGAVVTHGQYDPRPTPGIGYPREVRTDGWQYENVTVDAGTGSGDWPSCGFNLDLRADARSVDVATVFGLAGGAATRVKRATGGTVGCVEMLAPQSACTVKVYVEGAAGMFSELRPRAPGGRGIGITTSGQNLGVAMSPATGGDRAGCYLQLRNWNSEAKKFLVIWPPA